MRRQDTEKKENEDLFSFLLRTTTNLVDDNLRIIRNVPYVIAAAGIVVIARKVRLTNQFSIPSEIPADFFARNLWLRGDVARVEGLTLYVDHQPIWQRRSSIGARNLPVSLYKVRDAPPVLFQASEFLTAELSGKGIWFKLVGVRNVEPLEDDSTASIPPPPLSSMFSTTNNDALWLETPPVSSCPTEPSVDAVVVYRRPTLLPLLSRRVCLNRRIVEEGLGIVEESPGRGGYFLKTARAERALDESLRKAETSAMRGQKGVWREKGMEAEGETRWEKIRRKFFRR